MALPLHLNWEGDKVRMMFASSVRIFHFIFFISATLNELEK